MKIIGLGGEPATGKTTLFKNLRDKLDEPKLFKFKMVRGEMYNHPDMERNIFILGIYDNGTFSGTDRLSMAVQPQVIEFLKAIEIEFHNPIVLFEGDRLFNKSFISAIKEGYDTSLYLTVANEKEKQRRHVSRGDTQTEKWLKGRKTKIANILKENDDIFKLPNDTDKDGKMNLEILWQMIK